MTLRLLFLFFIALIIGCASPAKTLKEGDYQKAYKQASNQLKRGKSVNENKKVLKKSLTKIIAEESKKRAALADSEHIEDLEKALKSNIELQDKIEQAFNYIDDGTFQQDFDALREEANWMTEEIANTYFGFGQSSLNEAIEMNNKRAAREAYQDFLTAKKYGYSGNGINSLIEEAISFARMIYTVEAGASFGISYDWDIDRRFEDLEDYSNQFQKIIYERTGVEEKVDCHIEIDFSAIDIDNYRDTDRQTFTERIQTGTRTVTDADGNVSEEPVFENVTGEVLIERITKQAEWDVRVSVNALTNNCYLNGDRFSERIVAEIREYSWTGDERAIPREYRRNNRDRLPRDKELAEELLDILFQEIADEYF